MSILLEQIKKISQIVSVGSVDGVLTSAALMRLIGVSVDIEFTQAFTISKVDVASWKPHRNVAFVDLAVNNRDKAMTADFVSRIREAGHQIVAVIDEHSREDWLEILGSFDGLAIEPQSQAMGKLRSSGAVLLNAATGLMDLLSQSICYEADLADRMIFFGNGDIANQAMKSNIQDDTRRVYLVQHFARGIFTNEIICRWMAEYDAILANHAAIIADKLDLGNGVVYASAVGKTVDMTTLMKSFYDSGARVVVLEGEMFNKALGRKTVQIALGTNEKKLDLLAAIKAVVPSASGFAQKANVPPEFVDVAIAAVRAALANANLT